MGSKVGEIKISKAKIRGVHSFGMICSGKELNINDDHDGIWSNLVPASVDG